MMAAPFGMRLTSMHIQRAIAAFATAVAAGSVAAEDGPETASLVESVPSSLQYHYEKGAKDSSDADSQQQLYANSRRWEAGVALRVCLFKGNPVVAELIQKTAQEWNEYSSVKFEFAPKDASQNFFDCLNPRKTGQAQVRVAFDGEGFFSMVGRSSEALAADDKMPTMQLNDLNKIYSPERFQIGSVFQNAKPRDIAAIRHEFGHALGLLHELQNPKLNCVKSIKWTGEPNVFSILKSTAHWNEEMVLRNIGYIAEYEPDYAMGAPDPRSIMMYSLPRDVFLTDVDPHCIAGLNSEISDGDKRLIAKLYPSDQLVRSGDSEEDVKEVKVRRLPPAADLNVKADYSDRVLSDLESSDVGRRRDARARLSPLLREEYSINESSALVRRIPAGSYRYQLGIAVALSVGTPLRIADDARQVLQRRASSAEDPTLRQALLRAVENTR